MAPISILIPTWSEPISAGDIDATLTEHILKGNLKRKQLLKVNSLQIVIKDNILLEVSISTY